MLRKALSTRSDNIRKENATENDPATTSTTLRRKTIVIVIVIVIFALVSLVFQTINLLSINFDDKNPQKASPAGPVTSHDPPGVTTNVFFNVFTKNAADEERVQSIIDEQLSFLIPGEHKVSITSIGHRLSKLPNETIRQHYTEANEGMTLHAIWDYCNSNNNHDTKIVYLHSKGSYHDTAENKALRMFLTKGALSKECANLPDACNVCSSRFSPLPHAHTPGNMWLARCDYVAELI
jgi:hypothetical protein